MSNLKVNARTKFLEMRRKHNMLLENVNVKVETSNIQTLTNEELDNLKCGDIVVKKTGNQKHAYIVSYKENNQGICLTYCDGSGYIETISYDKVGENWVYNSTDIFRGQEELESGTNIKTINSQSLLGSGDIAISGGTQLYKHTLTQGGSGVKFIFISTDNEEIAINSNLSMTRDEYLKSNYFVSRFGTVSNSDKFVTFVQVLGPSITFYLKYITALTPTYSDITAVGEFTDTVTPV